jgi:hypothetical protein
VYFLSGLAVLSVSPLPLRSSPFIGCSGSDGRYENEHRPGRSRGLILGVFALLSAQGVIHSLSYPPIAFRSSPESYSSGAAASVYPKGDCLPCGSFPFDVFPSVGSHLVPEVTSLRVPVPSQRFARSQGFHPPTGCRPCFMPVPSLGFCPSGFISTRGAVPSLEGRCPLSVSVFSLCTASVCLVMWPR